MNTSKLSEEEFTIRAIQALRHPPYYGIHGVYSGFNKAFRKYFGTDPVEATRRLAREGKIEIRPSGKGVILFLPGSMESTLEKILDYPPPSLLATKREKRGLGCGFRGTKKSDLKLERERK